MFRMSSSYTSTEEGAHPMSWWTKTRILDAAEYAGVSAETAEKLRMILLEDLRPLVLRYAFSRLADAAETMFSGRT